MEDGGAGGRWRSHKRDHLKLIQAVMSYVHPEGSVPESGGPFAETVEEAGDSRVLPPGVEPESPVRLRQKPPVVGARPLGVPCGLLMLMDGVNGGVRVRQVGVGRVLALGV